MMDGTGVNALADRFAQPMELVIDGRKVVLLPPGWRHESNALPKAPTIQIGTLTGIADYLRENRDGLKLEGLILQVKSPTEVVLEGTLRQEPSEYYRERYLYSTALRDQDPMFGKYVPLEYLIVALRSRFLFSPERDELLEMITSVSDKEVRESVDDGIRTEVTVKRGVAVSRTVVKPIWTLSPFRTFSEVTQPQSEFLLRLRPTEGGLPEACLLEADGGAWRNAARLSIAEWLREHCKEVAVVA